MLKLSVFGRGHFRDYPEQPLQYLGVVATDSPFAYRNRRESLYDPEQHDVALTLPQATSSDAITAGEELRKILWEQEA